MRRLAYSKTGFTLIELMIVLVIVSSLIALVGPLAVRNIDKASAREEVLQLKNWLRKTSYRSFATGKEHLFVFSGKKIELFQQNIFDNEEAKLVAEKDLEHLFFQPSTLKFSVKGFASHNSLSVAIQGKTSNISLKEWVNSELANEQ